MARPPEMIKCGWENCDSWFSTGVDMNQHVLINHIKHMKIQFGDVDHATVEPKRDVAETPPKTPKNIEVRQITPTVSTTPLRQFPHSTSWAVSTHDSIQTLQHFPPITNSLKKLFPNPHNPDAPVDRKPNSLQFYDDDEEIIINEQPMSAVSTVASEISQELEEGTSGRTKKRQYDYDGEEEVDMNLANMTPERAPVGESSKKTKRIGDRVDQSGDKIPWALARSASHIPQPEIRLCTSFTTVGEMARAIGDELTVRKTLRKKNQSNGNYCVVCLDYRKDNGFCDYMHNNQHEQFIQFYHTLYKNERVSKQTLLQYLTEMQLLRDPLPELSTSLVRAPF
ncbi:hypothetical protein CRE_28284 [Caenorhabditis remanei]|uniref:Zap1-like C2H2 zinc finger 1 domain-containing protein n=1 Tax=Caenorhabditis remanei TaxID=31234 RepID=E3LN46_CAERE|nr:hypothetical protein CRE_28284 [Caenorhabditis remanei]